MTTYRGWMVYGPSGPDMVWVAVKGKERVHAGSAASVKVSVDLRENARQRASGTAANVFDTGAA